MNTSRPNSPRLAGFFRPVYRGIGFAIPVFEARGEFWVQLVETNRVTGYAACDVPRASLLSCDAARIRRIPTDSGKGVPVDLVGPDIGGGAWYAFQLDRRLVLLGDRDSLVFAISRNVEQSSLEQDPLLSAEIAEFAGDAATATKERERANALLNPPLKSERAPKKSEVLAQISKDTGLSRKEVNSVFDSLVAVIVKNLRGSGSVTLPGLLKLKVVKRPATKARAGIDPFTGEKMTFKPKPASKKTRKDIHASLSKAIRDELMG